MLNRKFVIKRALVRINKINVKCLTPWKTCSIDGDLETHPVGAGIQVAGSSAGSSILSLHGLQVLLECRVSFILFFCLERSQCVSLRGN